MPGMSEGRSGSLLCAGVLAFASLAFPGPARASASAGSSLEPRGPIRAAVPGSGVRAAREDTIPRVAEFVLDGNLGEWRSRSTDRVLPATRATPQALIWLGQVDAGLAVAAEIRSTAAPNPQDLRLVIRLADAEPPALPPIGWGHQFGFETLESEAECETLDWGEEAQARCAEWVRAQVEYRSRLMPLFERRWIVSATAPEESVETRARPAFEALAADVRSKLLPLEPSSAPDARARPVAGTPGALGLEVLVPWEAFPPVRALDLTAVRVAVGLVGGDLSPDAVRAAADLPGSEELLLRRLTVPREHRLTPCAYGLRQVALFSEPNVGSRLSSEQAGLYMIPTRSGDLRRLIVIDNEAAGYQYEPDSTTVSPAAFTADYSVLELGDDEVLCGPFLAYRRGERVSETADITRSGDEDPWPFLVDARHVETRRLEDGDWLVKEGPRVWFTYYGSGQCGGCPRVGVRMHHVNAATGAVMETLGYTQLISVGVEDVEIEVSEDWREIIAYESISDWEVDPPGSHWRATRYCFRDAEAGQLPRYDICGEEEPVPEPPDRLRLPGERGFDP